MGLRPTLKSNYLIQCFGKEEWAVCFKSVKIYFAELGLSNLKGSVPITAAEIMGMVIQLQGQCMKSSCAHARIFPVQQLYPWFWYLLTVDWNHGG